MENYLVSSLLKTGKGRRKIEVPRWRRVSEYVKCTTTRVLSKGSLLIVKASEAFLSLSFSLFLFLSLFRSTPSKEGSEPLGRLDRVSRDSTRKGWILSSLSFIFYPFRARLFVPPCSLARFPVRSNVTVRWTRYPPTPPFSLSPSSSSFSSSSSDLPSPAWLKSPKQEAVTSAEDEDKDGWREGEMERERELSVLGYEAAT